CAARRWCWRRSVPSEGWSCMSSCLWCRAGGGPHDEGRRAQHRLRRKIAAGKLAHQKLRGARAEVFAVDGDAGERGVGVLGFLDVVEADHAEIAADGDAG